MNILRNELKITTAKKNKKKHLECESKNYAHYNKGKTNDPTLCV